MFIPRHETEVLQKKLTQAIENGIGSTILISGEPGIGKTTLIKNFMDNCDSTSEKNVLTAIGSCLDMDGVSRGFLPWREVLIELDADKAAGKDEEKKSNFKKIVKTVFDEAGSQWLEAIPVIGDISSAIFETAKTISKDELIDVETGDTKKLALKDRLKNVAKECTGEWLNVIPVVGNLSAAIYKTTNAIQKSKKISYAQNQQDFFIHVMSQLRELAEHNPVMIYVDDLQWADISSMNLFFYLAKNLKDSPYPMVLIGSFRPQDVKDGRLNPISGEIERHPWEEKINNLKRYDAAEFVEVSYLNQKQISSYIDLQFPKNEFSEKFKEEIVNLTRGNSLFVRELLLNLEERKIIFVKNGTYFADETLDISTLPQTVTGIIEERFQRLSEDLQEILQIASAQGSDFSLELISAILEIKTFKLSTKMNALQQKYSLVLKSETVYDKLKKIYNFTHNLVQKYIYYQMSEDFRLDLHSALVDTLEDFFEGEEIYKVAEPYSYHFGVANGIIDENGKLQIENEIEKESLKKYLEFQKYLADNLKKSYQNEEAISKYSELCEIAKLLGDKKLEMKFRLTLAQIYFRVSQYEKALSFSKEALEECKKYNLRMQEADFHLEVGNSLSVQGNKEESRKHYEQSLALYEELNDKIGQANVLGNIGNLFDKINESKVAEEYFRKALKLNNELGNKSGASKNIGNIGVIYGVKGEFDKCLKYFEDSSEMRKGSNDKNGIALNIGNMGAVYGNKGEFDKALKCYKESLKISEEIGDRSNLSHFFANIGLIYSYKCEFEDALEFLHKSLKINEEIGFKGGKLYTLRLMAIAYYRIKNYPKTKECFEKILGLSSSLNFELRVIEQKMNFKLGDSKNPPKKLLKMLAETEDKEEIANLKYELWRMTSEEEYRIEALKLFQELYSNYPYFIYKESIDKLSSK
ncbi:MAG: hypothetical protein DWQ06_08685 [Calditrichaeota bacterium]|nr:MAG: hypothetical protein DWQ06_08685 [Calditrichota bacterium]